MTTLDRANDLLDQVLLASGEGDWAPMFLRAETTFFAQQPASRAMTFNVPVDADFHGETLNLFLGYRQVSGTSVSESDSVFSHADWSSLNMLGSLGFASATLAMKTVNGQYQSAPFDIASAFSTRYGTAMAGTLNLPITLFPSGLDMEGMVIPRGTAADVSLSIGYAAAISLDTLFYVLPAAANYSAEYRVVGVFQGRKNVRAFR